MEGRLPGVIEYEIFYKPKYNHVNGIVTFPGYRNPSLPDSRTSGETGFRFAGNSVVRVTGRMNNPMKERKSMTKTIAFLNQKGGSGKTTLSTNVSVGLALRGHRVLLVDADRQGSSLDWSASREGEPLFPVVGMPKPTLHKELAKVATEFDYVIIDGPPQVTDVPGSAIMASDLVLCPCTPSPYDIWATEKIVKLITEAMILKPDLKAAFVINLKRSNTAIGRDAAEALEGYELPTAKSEITSRVIFPESAALGLGVMEMKAKSPATGELDALIDEALEMLS